MNILRKLIIFVLTIIITSFWFGLCDLFLGQKGEENFNEFMARLVNLNPFVVYFWFNALGITLLFFPLFLLFYGRKRHVIVKLIIPMLISALFLWFFKLVGVGWLSGTRNTQYEIKSFLEGALMYCGFYFSYVFLDRIWKINKIGSE